MIGKIHLIGYSAVRTHQLSTRGAVPDGIVFRSASNTDFAKPQNGRASSLGPASSATRKPTEFDGSDAGILKQTKRNGLRSSNRTPGTRVRIRVASRSPSSSGSVLRQVVVMPARLRL